MVDTFPVEQRGVGKPDYSSAVSSALERRGISLGYNQTLKIFGLTFSNELSPFSWIVSPLASGAILHVIDASTGLASPLTIPAGYAISLIAAGAGVTEDAKLWGYIDGFLATAIGVFFSGVTHYENKILGLTTETIDPDGDSSHTIDITIENLGEGDLEGGIELFGIMEPLSTRPLPTTKTVRCKFCGHCEETVPQETVRLICPECGKLTLFYDLSRFKGTR